MVYFWCFINVNSFQTVLNHFKSIPTTSNPKLDVWSLRYEIGNWALKVGVWSLKFEVWVVNGRILPEIWSLRCAVSSFKMKDWIVAILGVNLHFDIDVWSLIFEVWSLKLETWTFKMIVAVCIMRVGVRGWPIKLERLRLAVWALKLDVWSPVFEVWKLRIITTDIKIYLIRCSLCM